MNSFVDSILGRHLSLCIKTSPVDSTPPKRVLINGPELSFASLPTINGQSHTHICMYIISFDALILSLRLPVCNCMYVLAEMLMALLKAILCNKYQI